MHPSLNTVTLALSGASGMAYGLRLLECLLAADLQVNLLVSQAAHIVAKQELGVALPARAGDLEKQLSEDLMRATASCACSAVRTGTRRSRPAPIRPMRWWSARARWARWPPSPTACPTT